MNLAMAKVIAAILLIIVPPLLGTAPYFALMRGARSLVASEFRVRVIKYANSLAGGVFFGALMLHMIAEGSEKFDDYLEDADLDIGFPIFNTLVAIGFFLVAFIEVIAHQYLMQDVQHIQMVAGNADVIDVEGAGDTHPSQHSPSAHIRAPATSGLRAILLVIALSFHTIFDGLAIGAQMDVGEVWSIFTAVILHKAVISFCLGIELFQVNQDKPWKAGVWLAIFTIMSPIGLGIGASLTDGALDDEYTALMSAILQGLSAGTFLYVTFLEILCFFIGHNAKDSSVLYLITIIVGFGLMAVAKVLDAD